MESSFRPAPGQIIAGQFRLEQKLGEGGMGELYLAHQLEVERAVVLKFVHSELAGEHPDSVARLRREAQAIALIDHPNVVSLYTFGYESGHAYLVLEYIPGRSLSHELKNGAMAEPRVVHVARQIAAGLAAAHQRGVLHRDLKPANVMLTVADGDRDFVKLVDFGIARLLQGGSGEKLTHTGLMIGTPQYMSPEQVESNHVDERSDIYCVGLIMYELLTGSTTFTGNTPYEILIQHVTGKVTPPRLLSPGVSAQLEAIVLKCLLKDPSLRFQSAQELGRALALSMPTAQAVGPAPSVLDTAPLPLAQKAPPQGRPASQRGEPAVARLRDGFGGMEERARALPATAVPHSKPASTKADAPSEVARIPTTRASLATEARRELPSARPDTVPQLRPQIPSTRPVTTPAERPSARTRANERGGMRWGLTLMLLGLASAGAAWLLRANVDAPGSPSAVGVPPLPLAPKNAQQREANALSPALSPSAHAPSADARGPSQAERQLGLAARCLNANAPQLYLDYFTYDNWVHLEHGPDPRVSSFGFYSASACPAAELRAPDPDLAARYENFAGRVAALGTLLDQANRYYKQQGFQADSMRGGQSMHAPLLAAFSAFADSERALRSLIESRRRERDPALIGSLAADSGERILHELRLAARELVALGLCDWRAMAKLSPDTYDASLAQLAATLERLQRDGSEPGVALSAVVLLADAKNFRRHIGPKPGWTKNDRLYLDDPVTGALALDGSPFDLRLTADNFVDALNASAALTQHEIVELVPVMPYQPR